MDIAVGERRIGTEDFGDHRLCCYRHGGFTSRLGRRGGDGGSVRAARPRLSAFANFQAHGLVIGARLFLMICPGYSLLCKRLKLVEACQGIAAKLGEVTRAVMWSKFDHDGLLVDNLSLLLLFVHIILENDLHLSMQP